jgi:hypothetical protein
MMHVRTWNLNTASSKHQPAPSEPTPAPTAEQIDRLGNAESKARWNLAELCLHRAALELLHYRPELRVLLIGEDDEGEWTPIAVSADLELREAESIEDYEQIETARGHAGELSNHVAELTGYEDVFAPYVLDHDGQAATCCLDLRAIFADALRRHAAPGEDPRSGQSPRGTSHHHGPIARTHPDPATDDAPVGRTPAAG